MAKKLSPKESEVTETKETKLDVVFAFNDSNIVLVKGTPDKRFSVSEDKEYKVTGAMAKILIEKNAADFVKIIK